MNYAIDVMELRYASIDDSAMEFSNPARARTPAARSDDVARAG
jgi:hypothetical protein